MQIDKKDIRPGDNLIFKRDSINTLYGKFVWLIAWLLKLFNSSWDMWGWHMGVVVWNSGEDWIVLEATWPVVDLKPLSQMGEYHAYRWFDKQPDHEQILKFVRAYLGKRYDVLLYPWTVAQYLFRHYWNRCIPRLLDDRYTCWELACEFDEAMGKPVVSKYDCPILPDIQKELEKPCV